jgi:hypothetical protein
MLDLATTFGIGCGVLQITQQLVQLGQKILAIPADRKAARAIREETKGYIALLLECQNKLSGSPKEACKVLQGTLQEVIDGIDEITNPKRKRLTTAVTGFRIQSPRFREKIAKAMEEFKLKMTVESQRQSAELLESMTKQMDELNITKTHLQLLQVPGMDAAIAEIDLKMRRINSTIEKVTADQNQIQQTLNMVPSLVAEIAERIKAENRAAMRDLVSEGKSCHTLNADLVSQLSRDNPSNDSLCRISAEMVRDPESITWYDSANGAESTRPFKVWCLDDPNFNTPAAEFCGTAVSSTSSKDPVDIIYTKRYVADDFDQNLSLRKRKRVEDPSPYVSLSKRQGHFQILQEFIPTNLAQILVESVPNPVLRKLLSAIRALRQEYAYVLLDRIIKNKIYDLPEVHKFEEMERGMIALQAEKMKATFHFVLTYRTCDMVTVDDRMALGVSR